MCKFTVSKFVGTNYEYWQPAGAGTSSSGINGLPSPGSAFGHSVSFNDRGNHVAIGAPSSRLNGTDSGLVGVFTMILNILGTGTHWQARPLTLAGHIRSLRARPSDK